ncbi:serine aminopeptidase domain-containing protein [Longirhabdus pacifica]|uniref:serine aminopeptidase domain-containing protein n=1 Tax=Longirhabdus pacifica TaxID=2305227 RepID=UPI0010086DA3|nr:alpha/beta hydrolase [Longirhabdus pacifica]
MWRQARFGSDQSIVGIVEQPTTLTSSVPLVVSFPGLGQAMSEKNYFFSNLRKRLAEDEQWIVQFDYVGGGDSEGELGSASISSMVADALEVLEDVTQRASPPCIYLVGHALGSIVAQNVALQWEAKNNIACYPIMVSPPIAPLPHSKHLFAEETLSLLAEKGFLDSKLLIPGDDYYTLSDFKAEHLDYVTKLGAHLLYLHGQCLSHTLIKELDALDPIDLFHQHQRDIHIIYGSELAEQYEPASHIDHAVCYTFSHGSHFFKHPAAMDEAIEIIRSIILKPACQCQCNHHACKDKTSKS